MPDHTVRFGLVLLFFAFVSYPAVGQYSPGDLIVGGYLVGQGQTRLYGVTPPGSLYTVTSKDWYDFPALMPSPDNRSLLIYPGASPTFPFGIYLLRPDATFTTFMAGYKYHPIDVDGCGNILAVGNDFNMYALSPGASVATLTYHGLIGANQVGIDHQTGDAIGEYPGSLLRFRLDGSNAVTTLLSTSAWNFAHNTVYDTETNAMLGTAIANDLRALTLTPPVRITTIKHWPNLFTFRPLSHDFHSGCILLPYWNSPIPTDSYVLSYHVASRTILRTTVLPNFVILRATVAGSRHLSGGNNPWIGGTYHLIVSSPNEPGYPYIVALSFGMRPGLSLPNGRTIHLNPDALFFCSLTNSGIFTRFQGVLNAKGEAFPILAIPKLLQLSGLRFFAACVTIRNGQFSVISAPIGATIR